MGSNEMLASSLSAESVLQILSKACIEAFILLNHDYQVLAFNQQASDLTERITGHGLTLHDAYFTALPPTQTALAEEMFHHVLQDQVYTSEWVLGEKWLKVNSRLIEQDTETRCIAISILDLTAIKQTEIEMQRANAQLVQAIEKQTLELHQVNQTKQAILDAASEVAFIATNTQGIITMFNHGAEKMLGYTAAEVIGCHTPLLFHLETEVSAYQQKLSQQLNRELGLFETFTALPQRHGSENRDWFYHHKAGHLLTVNLTVTCVRDNLGEIIGYLGVALDITQRKKAEFALQKLNSELEEHVAERTASVTDSLIILQDEINKRKKTEDALRARELQLKEAEIKYRHLFQKAPLMYVITKYYGDRPFIVECNETFLSTLDYRLEEVIGKPLAEFYTPASQLAMIVPDNLLPEFLQERVLVKRDGSHVITLLKAIGEREANGRISGIRAMYIDITTRRNMEQSLRQSEQYYRILARNIPHSDIYLFDRDLRFLVAEGHEMRRHGFSSEDFEGKLLHETVDNDSAAFFESVYRRALAGEEVTAEMHYGGQDYFLQTLPIRNDLGEVYAGISMSQNITERKRVALALEQSEELWRSLVENAPNFITKINRQGEIEFVNRINTVYGYTKEQMIGQSAYAMVDTEFQPILREAIETVFTTGEFVRCEVAGPSGYGGMIWYENHMGPVKHDGQTTSVIIISNDITEHKESLELLAQQSETLARSNADLQDFAFIASHDLQEPLRKIQTFGARLQAKVQKQLDERSQDYLARIISAAERGQQLVQNLLAYSRINTQGQPFIKVDLEALIHDVLVDLELVIEQTQAKIQIVTPLPLLYADPLQIRQLVYNLLSNSLKFQHPEITPEIKISAKVTSPTFTSLAQAPSGWCHLTLHDNGIGFEEKYAEKIFAPFQRLHNRQEYNGSGIGLAICRKIATRHGGRIIAKSQLGHGATFTVILPTHHEEMP